ncbi:RNase adapter RapZ [Methylophilus aquaticus]|uniref:RNase adapter RapZ n=1 Tax=Methylophilus aquaticus TaxID=1971610 RepID=A0ABT9JTN8_9PROT|nr:RNase adapter RapZ [Methylophilus aquaticus]MDP8567839.1 RNase adapter RapZ [Methylophilus aquaticus]
MQLVIVTGLSGSGKTIALRVFEDSGYYCIDNLPATLLPHIQSHVANRDAAKVAVSVDSRSIAIESLPDILQTLKTQHIDVHLLFLDASLETLVKRFSETRRKHPLSTPNQALAESIQHERDLLSGLSNLGHHVDTSNLSSNTLRNHTRNWMLQLEQHYQEAPSHSLVLSFISFGFKHGIPLDADFVFDVRSLPNPHYDPVLRPYNGKQAPIQQFLQNEPVVLEMQQDIQHYIEKWLPGFYQDHRSYVTVGIGCTGGQHRSVYLVEQLGTYFKQQHQVMIRHRELHETQVLTKP